MRVDFVVPRAKKGKKDPKNLVACCGPCNTIKGTRIYKNFYEAKEYVLAQREELRKAWDANQARPPARAPKAKRKIANVARPTDASGIDVEFLRRALSARG